MEGGELRKYLGWPSLCCVSTQSAFEGAGGENIGLQCRTGEEKNSARAEHSIFKPFCWKREGVRSSSEGKEPVPSENAALTPTQHFHHEATWVMRSKYDVSLGYIAVIKCLVPLASGHCHVISWLWWWDPEGLGLLSIVYVTSSLPRRI